MDNRAQLLDTLLDQLENGQIDWIEFGQPPEHNGYFTFFKIKYISTGGGMQFALKPFYWGRGEGSGDYYPPSCREQLKATIWKQIAKIEAPTAISNKIRKIDHTQLTFFPGVV